MLLVIQQRPEEVIVNVNNDLEQPTVNITAPVGGTVAGTIDISADASDNVGVVGVQFLLDGNNIGIEDLTAPYSISWNTNTVTDGNYMLTAKARDAAGNVMASLGVMIHVLNHPPDTEFPTVAITAPAPGEVLGAINITADANDNVAVVGVQFLLNGNNLGTEDLTAPYSVLWNTLNAINGEYTLTARVRDAAGNITTSADVIVIVNNPPDTELPIVNITSPATGNVSGAINITATASDNIAVIGVQFFLNGNNLGQEDLTVPYSISWNTVSVANGPYTITARARDAAGNIGASDVIVNVNNDVTTPTINITAPAPGNVSGTINVTASASDNVGVTGVQFLLDGNDLGAEDLTTPYAVSWNTFASINGSHTVTAKARDAAGNIATSSAVIVTVNNPINLLTALNFNEGTGTTAVDISGSNHNGILTSGPTWTTGKYGQGINLNGTSNYVNIADHNDFTLDPAQNYTWSAWVKNTSFKEWSTVWSQTINTSNFFYFYAHTSTDPDGGPVTNGISVYWWVNGGGAKVGVHSNNNVLTAGQWSHVAVTYNGSQPQNNRFTIYVNGVDVTARNDIASVGTITAINPSNIRIGSNQPFGEYLNGAVDEVRYYNRLLSEGEIQSDMNTPIGVDNVAPTVNISSPTNGSSATGTITITANAADNFGVAGVQFLLDGNNLGAEVLVAPYSISWNTITVTNGNHTLTARARDAAGNASTSAGVIVNVINDQIAPVVNITSPTAGDVTATISVTANATDNIAVVGVQFLLDGVNLGAEDLTAPYSVSWNTVAVANGNHTLTAKARDASGNIATSPGVIVTVYNAPDIESPTIAITAPLGGNVSGTINITVNANDNTGVAGVQFLLDGNNLGAEILNAPFSIQWNTGMTNNGPHTLSARARDAAGNTTTSGNINITVANTTPIISGISVSSITATSVIVKWTTNIPGTSQVSYGTTTAYGFSTLIDSAFVTAHSQVINGLNPGTLYHYQALSANSGGPAISADNSFTTANLAATLGTLNTHTILAYPTGKIVPWTPNPADGYSTVVTLAWNYLLNTVPNDPSTGKPAYYSRSYLNPNTQQVVNWDHNPAGLYAMLVESGLKYYGYSGNTDVMQLANDVALWHLDHGMTTAANSWASVPYSEGPYGSLTYNGANTADGVGNLEPDKIGELGYAWLQLYKFNGNIRFRDAAMQAANVLSSKIRVGTINQSPWPYRVNANTGNVVENYCSNVIGPISLFDDLIAMGLGNTATYQAARNSAWNWMMTFPMQNNVWAQYFEDVGIQGNYNSNLNQYNAMMTARYLLEHPEFDPNWETHVRGLITWVETIFGQSVNGATGIKEQQVFPFIMGSHTSRYASVNALLYEKTGDSLAKEKAYRSFNWATYMARSTGVVIDGPDVLNQWFSDGYGDYIRHFMTGMAAVPEWTPANQTHLLRSSSVVQNISYGTNSVNYTTYNANSVEVLHVNFNPVTITVDGIVLPQRADLNQPGWTLDAATKTLKIYHNSGTQISISDNTSSSRVNEINQLITYRMK